MDSALLIQNEPNSQSSKTEHHPGSSGVTRAGWLGSSWQQLAAPSAPASDLGASSCGRRPQPPLSCDLRLNHALFCCFQSAFSQQISTLYGSSEQSKDAQLGARQQRRTPTIHRERVQRFEKAG